MYGRIVFIHPQVSFEACTSYLRIRAFTHARTMTCMKSRSLIFYSVFLTTAVRAIRLKPLENECRSKCRHAYVKFKRLMFSTNIYKIRAKTQKKRRQKKSHCLENIMQSVSAKIPVRSTK